MDIQLAVKIIQNKIDFLNKIKDKGKLNGDHKQELIALGTIVKNLALSDVGKCVFCSNKPYKKGASYCTNHMECDDWS